MNNNEGMTKKQKLKAFFNSLGRGFVEFAKVNYLMFGYIACAFIIELTGIAVTAGKFYMTEPWLYFTLIAFVCLISQYLPGHKSRYGLFLTALIANFVIDFIFIVVYDSTGGTIFDYAMLNLRQDAMMIVESLPFSFTFVFVSGVTIALYGTLGFMFRKRMPLPNVTRSAAVTTSALIVSSVCLNVTVSCFSNYQYDSNDLSYMLYRTEQGTYSNKGIVGNFFNELVRGIWFSEIKVGDEEELTDFIYAKMTEPTRYTGEAEGYNTVTILCESFEWFTFLYDPDRYPNGYARLIDNSDPADVARLRANLHTLFPNLYKLYEGDSTIVLDNAHSLEKTDISENKSIIGNYPLYEYINYAYPTNTIPYSMPNILRALYGVESNSFHDGYRTFYQRNIHHVNALGFNSYTAAEDMDFADDDTGLGERNLDSEMMRSCKDKMFPTTGRFNTFITTITQHGQYAYRDNLKPYYDRLDALDLLPLDEDNEDTNALRYYCAAGMDLDKAIGIMMKDLADKGLADKTLITLFGDHNCYYQGVSNYVKNIYSTDHKNYTELYRVPVMMKVGENNLGNPHIQKFTCVLDIYPTILDLLGITVFSNLTYGVSAFNQDQTSVLYSRAYNKFLTDKIYFNSLSNINYKAADVDDKYIAEIEATATTLLGKISHVNRIFAGNFLSGERAEQFYDNLRIINASK